MFDDSDRGAVGCLSGATDAAAGEVCFIEHAHIKVRVYRLLVVCWSRSVFCHHQIVMADCHCVGIGVMLSIGFQLLHRVIERGAQKEKWWIKYVIYIRMSVSGVS